MLGKTRQEEVSERSDKRVNKSTKEARGQIREEEEEVDETGECWHGADKQKMG